MTYTLSLEEREYELVKALLDYGLDKARALIDALADPEEDGGEGEGSTDAAEATDEAEEAEEVEEETPEATETPDKKPRERKHRAAPEGLLNASQARMKLGISARQLYDITSRNLIPSERDGRRVYWRASDLDAYLAAQTQA